MIENFMDYSAETCQNTFTQGQADLMYAVLEAERFNLVHGNPAAINEVDQQNISIYPNPSTDQITITFTGEIKSIKIIDLYGKVISKYIEPVNGIQVDISAFESGLYFVHYQLNSGDTGSQRIVKQ